MWNVESKGNLKDYYKIGYSFQEITSLLHFTLIDPMFKHRVEQIFSSPSQAHKSQP
jgi:hypothetical protein